MKKFIQQSGVTVLAGITLAACVGITDPYNEDDHDKDILPSISKSAAYSIIGAVDLGGGLPRPEIDELCLFAVSYQDQGTTCFVRSTDNPSIHTPTACHTMRTGHTWIKAIGTNVNGGPSNVWVLVSNDDPHIKLDIIGGNVQGVSGYEPNLIHWDGKIRGHRECGFTHQILTDSCPSPMSPSIGNNSQCLFEAVASDPGVIGIGGN